MITTLLRSLITLYRAVSGALRPLPCCRFTPSCSAYASEALTVHGLCPGIKLTLLRLLRCHPWGGSGVDPVPMLSTNQEVQ